MTLKSGQGPSLSSIDIARQTAVPAQAGQELKRLGLLLFGLGMGARGLQGLVNLHRRDVAPPVTPAFGPHVVQVPSRPEEKLARDMPSFTSQDRPEKVKDIYRALKREHPGMPAEMKARIAARQGKPGKQKQGPPYEGPLSKESGAEDFFRGMYERVFGKPGANLLGVGRRPAQPSQPASPAPAAPRANAPPPTVIPNSVVGGIDPMNAARGLIRPPSQAWAGRSLSPAETPQQFSARQQFGEQSKPLPPGATSPFMKMKPLSVPAGAPYPYQAVPGMAKGGGQKSAEIPGLPDLGELIRKPWRGEVQNWWAWPPAFMATAVGGPLALAGGYKLTDLILDRMRRQQAQTELEKARSEYEAALHGQGKVAEAIGELYDTLQQEKRAMSGADLSGIVQSLLLLGAGTGFAVPAYMAYQYAQKGSPPNLLAKALQQRRRQMPPSPILAKLESQPREERERQEMELDRTAA